MPHWMLITSTLLRYVAGSALGVAVLMLWSGRGQAVGLYECSTWGSPQQCSKAEAYAYCVEHAEYKVSQADPRYGERRNPHCTIRSDGAGPWGAAYEGRSWTNPNWTYNPPSGYADYFSFVRSEVVDPTKNNECTPASGCTKLGNPINYLTGTKTEVVSDFEAAGHLNWTRYYSSVAQAGNELGALGAAWRHSFSAAIKVAAYVDAKFALLARPSGDQYLFEKDAAGTWNVDSDVEYQLTEVIEDGTRTGWEVLAPDNSVEHFDAVGRLLSVSYPDGEVLSLTYAGKLLGQVADRRGRRIELFYSGDLLTSVALPDGGVIGYQFDSSRRLTHVIYPQQTTAVQYRYENATFPFALTSRTDESGATYATWEYDSAGRAWRSVHGDPAGRIDEVRIAYGTGNVTVTNALGETSVHQVLVQHGRAKSAGASKACTGCAGLYATGTFDAYGYPSLQVAFDGTRTAFSYNARGLMEREEQAESDAVHRRVVETSWHPVFRLPVERRTYDASGSMVQKSTWSYNDRGQPLTYSELDPATGAVRTTTTSYCEQSAVHAGTCPLVGLILSVDGPRTEVSDITSYQYFATDQPECAATLAACDWRKGDLWKVTDATGGVTESLRYDGAGRLLSSKDINGIITDFEYGPRGRLTGRTTRGAN